VATPDFWLGLTDALPTDWGGPQRRCYLVDRPLLATGRSAWRVRVEPPLPEPSSSGMLDEVVVAERYAGERLEGADGWVTVNVAGYTSPQAAGRDRFLDGDLRVLYVAEAARSPELLPPPFDVERFWVQTLARIRRFVAEHGHAWVPDGYHDVEGRLDIIVGNIRFHHAGRAGDSDGPFPGIDYGAALDDLPGWEWEPSEPTRDDHRP